MATLPLQTVSPLPTATIPESVIEVEGVELPPGFSLIKFADLESRPTALAFGASGELYVTSVDSKVWALMDEDADGRADNMREFARGLYLPLGITVHPGNGDVYVSSNTRVTILRDVDGDLAADEATSLVGELPVGLHQNDNLKFGPDGMLYLGQGSTCDACREGDPRSGTILQIDPQSGTSMVYATGMRNPYDLAFHPETGELFATDNGRDDLGLDAPFEELNHVIEGGDYGWPGCWNAFEEPDCDGTLAAVGFFEAHASANSLDFYTGEQFPEEYHYDLFVAIFGSYLKPSVQTGIMRVMLTPAGESYAAEIEWFARFPEGSMPLGLIVGPDGALYVGDYPNQAIYRISYGLP